VWFHYMNLTNDSRLLLDPYASIMYACDLHIPTKFHPNQTPHAKNLRATFEVSNFNRSQDMKGF